MTDAVKRPYDATRRRERALKIRRTVLDTARNLLEERGYAATTIADVATAAGVSPESIYKRFGTKAALTKAVFDLVIAGDDQPVAVADRPAAQALRDEPDVREKLRLYALTAADGAQRSARVQLAIRNGASSDSAVAQLWQTLLDERLTGMTMLARHLVGTGQLRPGITVEETRDVLWTGIAVEIYDLLVLTRGWTTAAYADWLTRMLIASLT